MSTSGRRLVASLVVLVVVLGAAVARHVHGERRDHRVLTVVIQKGTARNKVIERLGEPDRTLGKNDLKSVTGDDCATSAATAIRYFVARKGGGQARTVYFDADDRVLCEGEYFFAL